MLNGVYQSRSTEQFTTRSQWFLNPKMWGKTKQSKFYLRLTVSSKPFLFLKLEEERNALPVAVAAAYALEDLF